MKRVVIVSDMIPPGYGGAGMAAFKHASNLNQEDQLHYVLTRTPLIIPKGFPRIDQFDGSELVNLDIYRVIPKSSFLLTHKFGLLKRIIPLLTNNSRLFLGILKFLVHHRKRFDIMHCYSTTWLTLFSTLIAKLFGKKVILEMSLVGHDDPRSISANDHLKIKYVLKRIQFKVSDRVVSKSLALSKEYLKTKLDSKKLVLIPYGIDTALFSKPGIKEVQSLKSQLHLDQYNPLLLFVGSITSRKGVDIAFKTLPLVRAKYKNAGLLVIGNDSTQTDDPELHRIVTRIKLNPDSGIIIKDPVENIKDFMLVSDLFLFPSRREGFGIVIIEAMASALPVIVKQISGVTDYIIDKKEFGILINSEDENEFCLQVLNLLGNVEQLKKLAENGIRKVRTNFDTSIIEAQYHKLYNSMS